MTKNELRQQYLAQRKEIPDKKWAENNSAIFSELSKTNIWEYAYYMLYLPIEKQNEPDLGLMMKELLKMGKKVYVPKIIEDKIEAVNYDFNTVVHQNEWGIDEPESNLVVEVDKIEIFMIPMIVCDKQGNRLGYGKGFYDRFLQNASDASLFIGVSMFNPIEEIIPAESTDIKLHYCASPLGFFSFSDNS